MSSACHSGVERSFIACYLANLVTCSSAAEQWEWVWDVCVVYIVDVSVNGMRVILDEEGNGKWDSATTQATCPDIYRTKRIFRSTVACMYSWIKPILNVIWIQFPTFYTCCTMYVKTILSFVASHWTLFRSASIFQRVCNVSLPLAPATLQSHTQIRSNWRLSLLRHYCHFIAKPHGFCLTMVLTQKIQPG